MADEKARKASAKQDALDEKQRFKEWTQIQEEAGYTVEGDTMANARVVELPEGPTHDDTPGA